MWDRRVVRIEECVGNFVVACPFRCVTENFEQIFAGVYGPNDDVERRCLWDELLGMMSWWEMSWCIGEDCNVVQYLCEKDQVIPDSHK